MHGRVVRMQLAVGLLVCFSPCLAQTGPSAAQPQTGVPDVAVYGLFLGEVARLASVPDSTSVVLNGEPSSVARPTPKERLGLTDREAEVLNQLAMDWSAESELLSDAVKRLTFERRLRVISSQEAPAWLVQGLRDLEERRTQIVVDHVQRLEEAFGAARFRVLNDYILSREKDKEFFPAPADANRPVVKKAAPAAKK